MRNQNHAAAVLCRRIQCALEALGGVRKVAIPDIGQRHGTRAVVQHVKNGFGPDIGGMYGHGELFACGAATRVYAQGVLPFPHIGRNRGGNLIVGCRQNGERDGRAVLARQGHGRAGSRKQNAVAVIFQTLALHIAVNIDKALSENAQLLSCKQAFALNPFDLRHVHQIRLALAPLVADGNAIGLKCSARDGACQCVLGAVDSLDRIGDPVGTARKGDLGREQVLAGNDGEKGTLDRVCNIANQRFVHKNTSHEN